MMTGRPGFVHNGPVMGGTRHTRPAARRGSEPNRGQAISSRHFGAGHPTSSSPGLALRWPNNRGTIFPCSRRQFCWRDTPSSSSPGSCRGRKWHGGAPICTIVPLPVPGTSPGMTKIWPGDDENLGSRGDFAGRALNKIIPRLYDHRSRVRGVCSGPCLGGGRPAGTVLLWPGHRDPFDHLLIAQALTEDLTFLSNDAWVGNYPVRHQAIA